MPEPTTSGVWFMPLGAIPLGWGFADGELIVSDGDQVGAAINLSDMMVGFHADGAELHDGK